MKETIGLISGLIVALGVIPYAVRTYQRKISPNLVSWSIWSILGLAILLTYRSSGAKSNIWPAISGFINPLVVAILAAWRGERKKPNKLELFCAAAGILCIVFWWFVKDSRHLAQYALYVAILADICAAIPTISFVWKSPWEDRPFVWVSFAIGYGLTVFAIEENTFANYVLPIYMLIGGFTVSWPLIAYRLRQKLPLSEWI